MPADANDIAVAQEVVAELNDIAKFMIGNPANASPGSWAPPAIPGVFDWRKADLWLAHGEKCYTKAQGNPAGTERYKAAAAGLPIDLIKELRTEFQRNPRLIDQNPWLQSDFRKEVADIIGTVPGKKVKVCAGCKKPVIVNREIVASPTGAQWSLIDHEPMCLQDKAMVRNSSGDFVESDEPGSKWKGKFGTTVLAEKTDGEMSPRCRDFLKTRGANFSSGDMYKFICKFRCNDHAAMTAYLLSLRQVKTHYEIIRNGYDQTGAHYYVVMGRVRPEGETHETNMLAGNLGGTPSQVFGPHAIILDSWSVKHGHKFPTAQQNGGIITDVINNDTWLVRPMEFDNALFPIAIFNTSVRQRESQTYSGLGVGRRESVR